MLVTVTTCLLLSDSYSNEYDGTASCNHVICIGRLVHAFQSPLNLGHLYVPCRFSMEAQATHRFLLVAMPEAGDCKIYLSREQ